MSTASSSSGDKQKATELLKAAAEKIDQSLVPKNAKMTVTTCRKMLRLVDAHGSDGVKKVTMLPNWSEGNSASDLPSGYRMIFDVTKAKVLPEAYPTELLYAGTMAFKISPSLLDGSMISSSKVVVSPSELLTSLQNTVDLIDNNSPLEDAYAGIFSVQSTTDDGYVDTYWAVTRNVDTAANRAFTDAVHLNAGKSVAAMLNSTSSIRRQLSTIQREHRANTLSQVLDSAGISVSPESILSSQSTIDTTSHSIVMAKNNSTATLFNDAVNVRPATVSQGMVLNENMRLGPLVLTSSSKSAAHVPSALTVLPSSTGLAAPLWIAKNHAKFDSKTTMSSSNAYVWDSDSIANHTLVSSSAFRKRGEVLDKMINRAGFSVEKTCTLRPIAAKIASQAYLENAE